MTRLTERQISQVWNAHRLGWFGEWHMVRVEVREVFVAMCDRIAALAVQEVERERDAERTSREFWWQAAQQTQADLDNTVREKHRIEMERDGFRDEVAGFEWGWEQREKAHDAETEAFRAQLATAKREGWYEVAQYIQGQSHHPHPTDFGVATAIRAVAENRYPYPATPSGEAVCGKCGTPRPAANVCLVCATPSPEAREVPSEVVVRVEDAYATEYSSPVIRITPADAKRIVAMGTEVSRG